MTKLYEILAVEKDLNKAAQDEVKRIVSVFGQPGKLTGQNISFHKLIEGEPELPDEVTVMATTVSGELAALEKSFGDYMTVTMQKEIANTRTGADVLIGDVAFLEALPAPALLNLESRLDELLKLYEAIPVLDPSERWTFDKALGYFVSALREQIRTKKVYRNHVLAEATKEHPAQVQVYQEDVPSYKVEKVISSGVFTPAEKAERIARIKKLAGAVKQARQRANAAEIEPVDLTTKIFTYINTGEL